MRFREIRKVFPEDTEICTSKDIEYKKAKYYPHRYDRKTVKQVYVMFGSVIYVKLEDEQ